VEHGVNGFLARTPEEWAEAVQRLAGDPQLRQRMGTAGRKAVEARFSVDGWAPRLAELIERVYWSTVGMAPVAHRRFDPPHARPAASVLHQEFVGFPESRR
ncbi:MAG: glycosyltransferase, partial [Planctomycetes bacterium]|nr:glycosyltransferase [Planctomycetota bacterium]